MAASINGNKIVLTAKGDSLILNCPIKKIICGGGSANIAIDNTAFYFSSSLREFVFPSLNGYPGGVLSLAGDITSPVVLVISEIGDVLNPNYFNEDIRNWNGQGAAAVSEASEAPKKATKAKKAEVNE